MTRIGGPRIPQNRKQVEDANLANTGLQKSQAPSTTTGPATAAGASVSDAAIDGNVAGDFARTQGQDASGSSASSVMLGGGIESQQSMNQAAAGDMRAAQKEMKAALAALLGTLDGDPATQKDLEDAQKKLEAFARADATFGSNLEARGGSMAPMLYAGIAGGHFAGQTALLEKAKETGYIPGETSANLDGAHSQMEMNMAAFEAFDKVDGRMKELVAQLGDRLVDDPEGKAELTAAQDAFGAFREAWAHAGGNLEARGGSLYNLVYAGVAESVTQTRIAQLEEKLASLGGPKDPADIDGDGMVTQMEMNMAAAERADAAQAKMEAAMDKAVSAFSFDDQLLPELQGAQKAFDAFVSADAHFYGNVIARGGSMMSMIYSGTQAEHFEGRAKDLEKAAQDQSFPWTGTAQVDDAANQQEMNRAAYASFDKADAEMDGVVGKLKTLLADDPDSLKELAAAQQAFADFREQQANVAGNAEARGGSLYGLVYASAAEGLTRIRLDQLKAIADELGG